MDNVAMMIRRTLQIHKVHGLVRTASNVAGAATRILTVEPGDNQILYWPNDLPILLKLFTAGGVEIAPEAELHLFKVWPSDSQVELLGTMAYAPWANTAFADQSDPERAASLAIPFHRGDAIAATIPSGYKLELRLNAASVVSWAFATTRFFAMIGQQIIS